MSPASSPRRAQSGTASRILDVAEQLVQVHGFNGFSYADVSAELGIRKASVHHHFPTKLDLAAHLIERYQRRFAGALARIENASPDAQAALASYAALYGEAVRRDRLCLCGMLAAEITALPRALRTRLRGFFDENEAWLARTLERGRKSGALSFTGSPAAQARLLLSALEGAMLVARAYRDAARFEATTAMLLAGMAARQRRRGGRQR
ncbi:MAG TPA: TetR family transcriptional regulator [Kofleriaceae bacterium]|nr:TetR family transcriptional regulator [Kofleriaceae bacterium]